MFFLQENLRSCQSQFSALNSATELPHWIYKAMPDKTLPKIDSDRMPRTCFSERPNTELETGQDAVA